MAVLDNYIWSEGNGQSVNFWMDNWIGQPLATKFKIPEIFHKTLKSTVSVRWKDGQWNLCCNIQDACSSLLSNISFVSVSTLDNQDPFVWKSIPNGMLTMKDAYKFVNKPCPLEKWNTFPWNKDSTPAHSIIVWRYMHHKTPTNDILHLRGFFFPSICNPCWSNGETASHLFFDYHYANCLWRWHTSSLQISTVIKTLEDCRNMINLDWSPQARTVIQSTTVCIFYHIWRVRNLARFEDKLCHWKSRIPLTAAHVNLVGNHTKRPLTLL